jgi:hypothetical protein
MKFLFIFLFFIFCFSNLTWARFEKVEYKEINFKAFTISLRIQNLDKGDISAHIEVRKNHDVLSKKSYEKIDGKGGHAAVYMSRRQPLDDVFLIHKFGDHDSRTFLINDQGRLFDLPGGEIFYDESAKIIFFLRNFETEPFTEYAAYNIRKKTMIFHYKDSKTHHAFNDQLHYRIMKVDKKYFAITTNKDKGGAVEFDLLKKKVKRSTYSEVSKLKLIPLSNL